MSILWRSQGKKEPFSGLNPRRSCDIMKARTGIIMKISTKGRYALRLMLDLALNGQGGAVSLRDVARRQEISDKYLEQIVIRLSRAGLVRSVRGGAGAVIC